MVGKGKPMSSKVSDINWSDHGEPQNLPQNSRPILRRLAKNKIS